MTIPSKALRVLIIVFLFICQHAHAQVKLPRLISDGMVMQRDAEVRVWGWAAEGEKVTVHFNNKIYQAITDATGKWFVTLPSMKAGGPYIMTIEASNTVVVKDILIGDVWICSGQSNMALPMERVKERYADVIAKAENLAIRNFFLSTQYEFKKLRDDVPSGSWEPATPASVLKFGATAYFFAKAIYEKYRIPIGLINASVGGSPADAWLSPEALKKFPEQMKEAERFKNDAVIDSILSTDRARGRAWYNYIRQHDAGYSGAKRWYDTTYTATDWPVMNIPGYWSEQGLSNLNGVVWYRKEIDIPASMAQQPAKLLLGCIVDSDSVYINGVLVGTTGYRYPPRRYTVPAGLLKPGKNIVVIRVINTIGKGGFVEDKVYQLSNANATVNLSGSWQYRVGAVADPLPPTTFIQYKPGGLFNAMIAPLLHFPMKGVIWYQGESNTGRANTYHAEFRTLIEDWRRHWSQGDFPFIYVQLANYMPIAASETGWAELREAQLKTLSVPNTGMAVTVDIGEWNDLHPLNKEDVGKRLARAAQHIAYGEKSVVYSGPIYQSMKIVGDKIVLRFANTGSGLVTKNNEPLKYIVIAGADKKSVPANAKIEGNTIVVWSPEVKKPVAVRYAFIDNPQGANLYNKEGLPASPFRTDQ
jgi:sialate O-acetylesterase